MPEKSTFTSQEVMDLLGASYNEVNRLIREGFVRPKGYTGRHRTPIPWEKADIERADVVLRLQRLGLKSAKIREILSKYGELFDQGYRPMWIADRLNEWQQVTGRALLIVPEVPVVNTIPEAPQKKRKGNSSLGKALIVPGALHLPIEEFEPRGPRITKEDMEPVPNARHPLGMTVMRRKKAAVSDPGQAPGRDSARPSRRSSKATSRRTGQASKKHK